MTTRDTEKRGRSSAGPAAVSVATQTEPLQRAHMRTSTAWPYPTFAHKSSRPAVACGLGIIGMYTSLALNSSARSRLWEERVASLSSKGPTAFVVAALRC